jgi:hypothetical protein
MVESAKNKNKNSFGLLELENGKFGLFFEKNGLGPLGVNSNKYLCNIV